LAQASHKIKKDKADFGLLHSFKVTIVFKDLQKLVSHSQQQNKSKELFQRLQGKPFWMWDIAEQYKIQKT
jgi:hypothetical protein